MDIFENKEFIKSSKNFMILGVIALIFINIGNLYISTIYKNAFINYQRRTTAVILDLYPEAEEAVVKAITKGQNIESENKGKAILNKYMYNENIKNSFFNDIIGVGKKCFYLLNIFILVLLSLAMFLNYKSHKKIYEKISLIEKWVDDLLINKQQFKITNVESGEISKLLMSINKVNRIVWESLENVKKEKKFLINLLSDISHQLKTPLSSIMLNNELLCKREFNREMQIKVLHSNEKQLVRMQTLVENLLKLAKLDAGAIKFKNENIPIKESVIGAVSHLEKIAESNKVTINIRDESKDNRNLYYDKFWMEEAFLNVIKNCIEHSYEEGEVTIIIREENIFTRIIVEDKGEGIHSDEIDYVFNRFFKSSRSKKRDSAGIGLALAKTIIEGQNGSISVSSEIGVGTRFEIVLLQSY